MKGLSARLLCVRALIRTVQSGSYGNLVLWHTLLRSETLDAHEKALVTAIFQGTAERLMTLDACIAKHSSRPPEKLDLPVLCVLRCGMYELLYLRTPEAAAVNLWTEAVKALKKSSAAGAVNAVLRSFLRAGKEIPVPDDPLDAMSVRYSVPVPLLRLLLADYGAETVTAFLSDALDAPPVYLRRNPLAGGSEEDFCSRHHAEPVPGIPFAYCKERGGNAAPDAENTAGDMHMQDLASQLCCLALDPKPGETVLDVCAAPGGKSFTAAEMMQNQGQIFAYDLHAQRVRMIRQGAERLGLSCITAQTGDARLTDHPAADRVLCDVPCSGYGVMRRKPEIRYKSPDAAAGLPQIQYEILSAAAKAVKPGGVLVYSTCTVLRRENEAVVRRFLAESPDFTPIPPFEDYPEITAQTGSAEMLTLFPQMLRSDGFFIAKLRRR